MCEITDGYQQKTRLLFRKVQLYNMFTTFKNF